MSIAVPAKAPASKQESYLQTCKGCQHEFRAPAKLVGKDVPCPYCRRTITIVGPAPVANEDKLVGKEIGGCRLLKRLGAGAMGVVYAAEQVSMGRQVAIKMLSSKASADPEVVQRFQREAKLCASIRHPHVVAVYDCGMEKGVHYLIMEWVDGCSFAGLIEENFHLPWRDGAAYVIQIARALEHAHGQGIIHRDIKPANVLIDSSGVAKLADLGLAKQIDAEGDANGLTMQGVAMGSPAYMPPEQIRSARDATPISDLYALGASFYQAITGKLPFDGRSATEVMTKVLRETAPRVETIIADIPPGISWFIDKALSKDPKDRCQSAAEFIAELEIILAAPTKIPAKGAKAKAGAKPGSGTSLAANRAESALPPTNLPLIIGGVVGALVIIGGLAWLLVKH